MKEDERNELLAQAELGKAWNYYKMVGSRLLQGGHITPEEYHDRVRAMGVHTNSIDPNDKNIPEKINNNDGLKMGLEIGGAVAGSLLWGGARLAHPLGWLGWVAQQSITSGAGAAGGNLAHYAYHKIMGSPEYATRDAYKDAMEIGTGVAGFNAAFMAAMPVGGKLIKSTYQLGKGTLKMGYGAAKMIPGVGYTAKLGGEGMQKLVGHMNASAGRHNEFANKMLKIAEERGIVLTNAMLLSPNFRFIAETFATTPFVGTGLRKGYQDSVESIAKSLMDDVANGATLDQAAAKFSNRFKVDKDTGRIILDKAKGYDPRELNAGAIANLLNKAAKHDKSYNDKLNLLFGEYKKGSNALTGVSKVLPPIFSSATGNFAFKAHNLKRLWREAERVGADGRYPNEFIKIMKDHSKVFRGEDGGFYSRKMKIQDMKRLYNDINKVERDLLNKVDGSFADDVYQNLPEVRAALRQDLVAGLKHNLNNQGRSAPYIEKQLTALNNQLDDLGKAKNSQLDFINKADETGMLSAANIVFRDSDAAFASLLNSKMTGNYFLKGKGKTYKQMIDNARNGNFEDFVLPGATTKQTLNAIARATGQKGTDISFADVMQKTYMTNNPRSHKNLMELIGQKEYNTLVTREFDDLLDATVVDFINQGKGPGRQAFLESIGAAGTGTAAREAKERTTLLLKNLNEARKTQKVMVDGKTMSMKPIEYEDLKNFGTLLSFLPEKPALNSFIQRSLSLKLAGGLSAGAVTGFVGIGGGAAALSGSPLIGFGTAVGMRMLANLLGKPATYDATKKLLAQAPSNPEARQRLWEQLHKNLGPVQKLVNATYLKLLQEQDPALLKVLRLFPAAALAQPNGERR